jgi:hypothetical protein
MSDRACRMLDAIYPVVVAWMPVLFFLIIFGGPETQTQEGLLEAVRLFLLISVLLLLATVIFRRAHRFDGLATSLTVFFVLFSLLLGRAFLVALWPELEVNYPTWNIWIRVALSGLTSASGLVVVWFIADLPNPDFTVSRKRMNVRDH